MSHHFLAPVPCTHMSGLIGSFEEACAGFWFRLGGWIGVLSPAEKPFVFKSKQQRKQSPAEHTLESSDEVKNRKENEALNGGGGEKRWIMAQVCLPSWNGLKGYLSCLLLFTAVENQG